ncbi:hypothetical protein ACGVWS_13680 [Enterobacteriaceae bacterium LUAb1]
MIVTESYTPQYVRRLQRTDWACQCPVCQGKIPLVSLQWQNQIRHSALITCKAVAAQVTGHQDAFVLQNTEEAVPSSGAVLDDSVQILNQKCIHILTETDAPVAIKMYMMALAINKAENTTNRDEINQIVDGLQTLYLDGTLTEAFAQLPTMTKYKIPVLRELVGMMGTLTLSEQVRIAVMLKANEFMMLSDVYITDELTQLAAITCTEKEPVQWYSMWINVLLYDCFHHVFPGEHKENWQKNLLQMCTRYFLVTTMIALLKTAGETITDEIFTEMLTVPLPQATEYSECDDILLIALSLLK